MCCVQGLFQATGRVNLGLALDSETSPAVEEVYLAPEYICHFFPDSLSTDSSDFKSAGCQVGKFEHFKKNSW